MKMHFEKRALGVLTVALAGAVTTGMVEAATITVDGHALQTTVAPIQRNGRTLVPLRSIFEALGASVVWHQPTQSIAASRGTTDIGMRIGNRNAQVDGRQVWLDEPASIYRGSTMVPLRFVAESLGARVEWNNATEVASIVSGGQAVAAARTITVLSGAVVKVKLDSALSSATARAGDRFSSTIETSMAGDSEFPAGSRIMGTITDASRKDGDQPGMLDLSFQSVVMSDGRQYPLHGALTSLDSASVDTSTPGRTMGKAGKEGKNKLVMVGIGAGVGLVLGKVLKTNSTITTLLGGLAGYLLGNKGGSTDATEALLPAGTQLGVLLDRDVVYADANDYYRQRSAYMTR